MPIIALIILKKNSYLMKNILTLILLIFLAESCSIISNPLTKQRNLKGLVKSIRFEVFDAIEKDSVVVKGQEQGGFFSGNELTIFDKKGYLTQLFVYSSDNKSVEYHITFKYNSKGLLIEEKDFYSNGDIKSVSVYKYNGKKDSLTVKKTNSSEGIKNYIHKYDKNNNLIYNGNTLSYDKKNNLIKVIDQYSTCNYKYDEKGNMIEKKRISPYGTIYSIFEYKNFDNQANWIKQLEYRECKAKFISERKIEYY